MNAWLLCFAPLMLAGWWWSPGSAQEPNHAQASEIGHDFVAQVWPILENHCAGCHDSQRRRGDVDLTIFAPEPDPVGSGTENDSQSLELWAKVRRQLTSGAMPPEIIEDRPTTAEIETVTSWMNRAFPKATWDSVDAQETRSVTARRLNRFEYQNAMLDLCGVHIEVDEFLPADSVGEGFDNIGDMLSMPPVLLEKYMIAAERVAIEALPSDEESFDQMSLANRDFKTSRGNRYSRRDDVLLFTSQGTATHKITLQRPGTYRLKLRASGQQAGGQACQLDLSWNGKQLERFEVSAQEPAQQEFQWEGKLELGSHELGLAFANDFYNPDHEDPSQRDRNLIVVSTSISGPLESPTSTHFKQQWFPEGRPLRENLSRFASTAWRRPLHEIEQEHRTDIDELLSWTSAKDNSECSNQELRMLVSAILVSPRFLFRIEPAPKEARRQLDDFELAARLAALLWSSVPDTALLAEANEGLLSTDAGLAAAIRRMLLDARSTRLVHSFADQWLQLRLLDEASPDPKRFPDFDDVLREAMRAESQLFFEAMLREQRPLRQFLDADFTFVNQALAEHYGMESLAGSVSSQRMQRVSIPPSLRGLRGGLLGQASMHVVTSNATRTSPVMRGKYILEAMLAQPPPPPPPGVDNLSDAAEFVAGLSLRERLEQHRADPQCAVCHEPMDALGFTLENYNAIGAWRWSDGQHPVDSIGQLPNGSQISGPQGLAQHLLNEQRFLNGLLHHLATFALGRGLNMQDKRELDQLGQQLGLDSSLAQAIEQLVLWDKFRHRYR